MGRFDGMWNLASFPGQRAYWGSCRSDGSQRFRSVSGNSDDIVMTTDTNAPLPTQPSLLAVSYPASRTRRHRPHQPLQHPPATPLAQPTGSSATTAPKHRPTKASACHQINLIRRPHPRIPTCRLTSHNRVSGTPTVQSWRTTFRGTAAVRQGMATIARCKLHHVAYRSS